MSSKIVSMAVMAALAFVLAGQSGASERATRIGWDALLPPGSVMAELDPLLPAKSAMPSEEPAWNLTGKPIELTGFLLPSDREGDTVFEFLLVPWAGACSHMPSPPPNQVVLVTPSTPYQASGAYEVVTISGALVPDLTRTQLFILDGVKVVESGYRVGRAQVVQAHSAKNHRLAGRTPWGFLEN